MRTFLATLAALIQAFTFEASALAEIKADETIAFFPGVARQNPSGSWILQIRGWIFEQEKRPGMAAAFREAIKIDFDALTESERRFFDQRTQLFLIDGERGKPISIRLGNRKFKVGVSNSRGHFSGEVKISAGQVQKLQTNGIISFQAVLPESDSRTFSGVVHLLSQRGLSVVSDIDDTIKISQVRERGELLRNTFCRPFKPAPGMAELYVNWATHSNIAFHFVSASPAQLYPPLAKFLETNFFPPGSVHLSVFDWKKQALNHGNSGVPVYKPSVIEPLLKQFPQRQFVLVGDSGELDPEIYGDLARKFPEQVRRIFIRDVTNDSIERYEKAFRTIPPEKWKVFQRPEEIQTALPK